jgi:hypothetical protein
VLSRYTVLPWEDENEYRALVEALVVDHRPQGPIEEHLIEELAGIVWRKRRLRLAEASACHRGLKKTTEPHKDTVKAALVHLDVSQQTEGVIASILATSESTARDIIDLEEDEAMTSRAVDVLRDGKAKRMQKRSPRCARTRGTGGRRFWVGNQMITKKTRSHMQPMRPISSAF